MKTLNDLYLRVMKAIESAHPSTKADVDAAFAEHEAAQADAAPEQAVSAAGDTDAGAA